MDIEKIITDAIEKYNSTAEFKVFKDEVLWYAWPQSWSDTSCGLGGMAGQMFCTAQTVVVKLPYDKEMGEEYDIEHHSVKIVTEFEWLK